jgi:hypothetical protein
MSAVLRRGRLVWRPLRHGISRYVVHTFAAPLVGASHLLLQQLPLPLHCAPAGSLHSPPQQTLPPVQTVPQAPQLMSVFRAVHTPLQHPCPVAHVVPQVPQLFASVVRLTHWPLQRVCGGVHTVWHIPLTQLCPGWQEETHPPVAGSQTSQLAVLQAVARQVPPQILASGQQTPAIQVSFAPQVETHLPVAGSQTSQLVALQAVARQVLPHTRA